MARLDGSMNVATRRAAVADFREGAARVLLVSSRAGGTGLNLTAGSFVFVMEPDWNPAVEEQAIDRCHRLGQTRPVSVVRYVAQRTIEMRVVELADSKRCLGRGAMQKLSAEELRKMRAAELKRLFDPFIS